MTTELQAQTTQNSGFSLQPESMGEAMKMATMLSNSQMIPKNFQNKPEDTLVAMMMGVELKLNPIQSLQNIAVINGRPSVWGDAMLALVQNHSKFGGIDETFNDESMTAICIVWRKGGKNHTVAFSQKDAVSAGLWGKQGPWKQYPKRMLQLRARGFALRDQFADALSGLISAEEATDMPEEPIKDMGDAVIVDMDEKKSAVSNAKEKAKTQRAKAKPATNLEAVINQINKAATPEDFKKAGDEASWLNDADQITARELYAKRIHEVKESAKVNEETGEIKPEANA